MTGSELKGRYLIPLELLSTQKGMRGRGVAKYVISGIMSEAARARMRDINRGMVGGNQCSLA